MLFHKERLITVGTLVRHLTPVRQHVAISIGLLGKRFATLIAFIVSPRPMHSHVQFQGLFVLVEIAAF